jgi:hypothetical protein
VVQLGNTWLISPDNYGLLGFVGVRHDVVGGGASDGWRRRMVAACAFFVIAVVVVVVTEFIGKYPGSAPPAPHVTSSVTKAQAAVVTADQAAAWVARQVSPDAIVACDPRMCSALTGYGVPQDRQLVLRASSVTPLGADVVVATATVRGQFGPRLASVFAPQVIASFGSGAGLVAIRVVAPDGAAVYESELASDAHARMMAGQELLRNGSISMSASARAALAAGEVDPRLLVTLAALAGLGAEPVRVVAFGDPSPGASVPLRSAELAGAGDRSVTSMLTFLRAQRPPYLPAIARIVSGLLNVEYAAPSPLGLLNVP